MPLVLGAPARAAAPAYESAEEVYAAVASLPAARRAVGGGNLELVFTPEVPQAQRPSILAWVDLAGSAIAHYLGGFPVEHAAILVVSIDGDRVGHGTAWGHRGPVIRVSVGRDATAAAFKADWILAHEMVHLAFPSMWRRHLWLQEGSASYVEPIARAQAGQITPLAVWREFAGGMPNGMPQVGDQGLDRTHTWGRTYWGGALFCLQADVQMRQQTGNRLGLQDALRAIARESGGNGVQWSIEQVLESADRAIGVPVLARLYADMGQAPGAIDLAALLSSLGVVGEGGATRLDNGAPLAAVRTAITAA